jgi:hypothetical protein
VNIKFCLLLLDFEYVHKKAHQNLRRVLDSKFSIFQFFDKQGITNTRDQLGNTTNGETLDSVFAKQMGS